VFDFIRNWLDRRVLDQSSITGSQWSSAFASLALLDSLSDAEKKRLRELVILFLHRKSIEGADGLVITQAMALIIALQACLLVLALGLEPYSGWSTIIVYPSGFAPERVVRDEYGVEHHVRDELAGEAWQRGPLILSWDEAEYAGVVDGSNLVIHEFAHKLDMQNGEANGFPPLHRSMDGEVWTNVFSAGFENFQQRCQRGEHIGIDYYAATSPAEFFAVLSEIFFERPDLLCQHYAEIYEQMRQYYRQHPLQRLRR
jgi:Mlc titration factor MtfA (ptsG expression regulator)